MELQKFIDQIADKIRQRGYRYWHEGRIESLEKLSDNQWWAQVQGRHPDLDAIERDADKLLEADADQALAAYEQALDAYAERNTGRPYYREICGRLRTLSR